jgi:hypothetical protein
MYDFMTALLFGTDYVEAAAHPLLAVMIHGSNA